MNYFELLGYRVRDRVTGYTGIAESVCFDLYGCIQYVIRPQVTGDKQEFPDGRWFDFKRLERLDLVPVMEVPSFSHVEIPGGTGKPDPCPSIAPSK